MPIQSNSVSFLQFSLIQIVFGNYSDQIPNQVPFGLSNNKFFFVRIESRLVHIAESSDSKRYIRPICKTIKLKHRDSIQHLDESASLPNTTTPMEVEEDIDEDDLDILDI